MRNLKLFNSVDDAIDFELSENYVEPYASFSINEYSVRYNMVPHYVDATYSVSNGNYNTVLARFYYGSDTSFKVNNLAKVLVDGEEIDFDPEEGYISASLSTGTHNVRFVFLDDEFESVFFNNIRELMSVEFHGFKKIYGPDAQIGYGNSRGHDYSFYGCDNLQSIIFDDKLETVDRNILFGMPSGVSVTFMSENFNVINVGGLCEWVETRDNDNNAWCIPDGTRLFIRGGLFYVMSRECGSDRSVDYYNLDENPLVE